MSDEINEKFDILVDQIAMYKEVHRDQLTRIKAFTERFSEIKDFKAELEKLENEKKIVEENLINTLKEKENEQKKLQDQLNSEKGNKQDLKQEISEKNKVYGMKKKFFKETKKNLKSKESELLKLKEEQEKILSNVKPIQKMLINVKGLPLSIEDVKMRTVRMKEKIDSYKDKDYESKIINERLKANFKEVEKEIFELRKNNKNIENEVEASKKMLEDLEKRIDETVKTLKERELLLEKHKNEVSSVEDEKKNELQKLVEEEEELKKLIEEKQNEINSFNDNLEREKAAASSSIEQSSKRINEIRENINYLKEHGEDELTPRVDKELTLKYTDLTEKLNATLKEKSVIEYNIASSLSQIESVQKRLHFLTLKMDPTPKIIGSAEFESKQLLLEEMIMQNIGMDEEIKELKSQIEEIKAKKRQLS